MTLLTNPAEIDAFKRYLETVNGHLRWSFKKKTFQSWDRTTAEICAHNNEIFQRYVPQEIFVSVDVAYRLAAQMTAIHRATDHFLSQSASLHERDKQLGQSVETLNRNITTVKAGIANAVANHNKRDTDRAVGTCINIGTSVLLTVPTGGLSLLTLGASSIFSIFKSVNDSEKTQPQVREMEGAIAACDKKLKQCRMMQAEIATTHIPAAHRAIAATLAKRDPLLWIYKFVEEDGAFILKRGQWVTRRIQNAAIYHNQSSLFFWQPSYILRTPYEIAVSDVGIDDSVVTSQHWKPYGARAAFQSGSRVNPHPADRSAFTLAAGMPNISSTGIFYREQRSSLEAIKGRRPQPDYQAVVAKLGIC